MQCMCSWAPAAISMTESVAWGPDHPPHPTLISTETSPDSQILYSRSHKNSKSSQFYNSGASTMCTHSFSGYTGDCVSVGFISNFDQRWVPASTLWSPSSLTGCLSASCISHDAMMLICCVASSYCSKLPTAGSLIRLTQRSGNQKKRQRAGEVRQRQQNKIKRVHTFVVASFHVGKLYSRFTSWKMEKLVKCPSDSS